MKAKLEKFPFDFRFSMKHSVRLQNGASRNFYSSDVNEHRIGAFEKPRRATLENLFSFGDRILSSAGKTIERERKN